MAFTILNATGYVLAINSSANEIATKAGEAEVSVDG
jgi:hypothetical protein